MCEFYLKDFGVLTILYTKNLTINENDYVISRVRLVSQNQSL